MTNYDGICFLIIFQYFGFVVGEDFPVLLFWVRFGEFVHTNFYKIIKLQVFN